MTVMVKVHLAVFPVMSVALSLTLVVPILIFILEENAGMVMMVGLYPELSATNKTSFEKLILLYTIA